jgi:Methyltransferase domain
MPVINFDGMSWEKDRLRWRDLVFHLEDPKRPVSGREGLVLWKSRALVWQYASFWAERPAFHARRVFELGVWKGGSVAFWAEALKPERLVAVDRLPGSESPAFDDYLSAHASRLEVKWGVDQEDREQVRAIAEAEFPEPLDLVIDDASHLYGPTRASFESLFPRLRPGGLYMVEDWAWAHWAEFQGPRSAFARQIPLTRLVEEFVAAIGTGDVVRSLSIRHGFVVVERGEKPLPEPFSLDAIISWGAADLPRSLRALGAQMGAEILARLRRRRLRS